jgi:chaperonin cofactor prefoldin
MEEQNETQDFRIEKLEFDKEETEKELESIEITLQKLVGLNDETPSTSPVKQHIKNLLIEVEHEKQIDEEILGELNDSIEFVRTH